MTVSASLIWCSETTVRMKNIRWVYFILIRNSIILKSENIGLIEVMGLFILPGRLNAELDAIKDILTGRKEMNDDIYIESHPLNKHLDWIKDLIEKHGNNLDDETSEKIIKDPWARNACRFCIMPACLRQLEEATLAFNRFLETAGIRLA